MKWYIDSGPQSDVILSSRVRLARNLNGYSFPNRMKRDESASLAKEVLRSLKGIGSDSESKFRVLDMSELGNEDKMALVERHLISEELTEPGIERYAYIRDDESVSVMINEEDHIRIQAMEAGLKLDEAYKAACGIAIHLEKTLSIGYHEKYGFMTACPSNTGTGMRASVIMHLPALAMTEKAGIVIERIRKMGYSVRGYYGEHSTAQGSMFQISNQITLGLDEEELLADLKKLIAQIADQERSARKELFEKHHDMIEDRVFRALGILKYAKILSSEETLQLISDVRLGKSLGIISQPDEINFNRMMSSVGPANIQKNSGKIMDPAQRDKARALIVKKELEGVK